MLKKVSMQERTLRMQEEGQKLTEMHRLLMQKKTREKMPKTKIQTS